MSTLIHCFDDCSNIDAEEHIVTTTVEPTCPDCRADLGGSMNLNDDHPIAKDITACGNCYDNWHEFCAGYGCPCDHESHQGERSEHDPMYPPAPPTVVCPVCDRTVTRTVLADPPVHRSCGRELESVWTYCIRCQGYRHHGQFATRQGEMSVCHECGKTKRFRIEL